MSTLYWTSTSSTDPSVAGNWSTGSAPVNGDDVYLVPIPGVTLANIAAHDMHLVVLNSLNISKSFLGQYTVGASGAGGYWQIGAATVNIGTPSGDGSSASGPARIKLDLGTGAVVVNVLDGGSSSADSPLEGVRLLAVNASNVLNVIGGRVGIATNVPGEVSTFGTINVTGGNSVCNLAAGVTWTTADVASGGTLNTNSGGSSTVLNVGAQSFATINGTTKVATITNYGTLTHNVRPAAGAASDTINNFGIINFSQNPTAGTITTFNANAGSFQTDAANPTHITLTTLTRKVNKVTYAAA